MTRSRWFTRDVTARIEKASERALRAAAEHVLEEANRTVPVDEGTLRATGNVDVDGRRATVSYDTPYARRQHEDLTLRHEPGRRARWLALTLTERREAVLGFLRDALKAAHR